MNGHDTPSDDDKLTTLESLVERAVKAQAEHAGLLSTVVLCHKLAHAGKFDLVQEVLCFAFAMLRDQPPPADTITDLRARVNATLEEVKLAEAPCAGNA